MRLLVSKYLIYSKFYTNILKNNNLARAFAVSESRKGFGFIKLKTSAKSPPKIDDNEKTFTQHLVNGKFSFAQKLLFAHPQLAATVAPQIIDRDGRVFENIPVFKYILWTGNMTGVEIFPRDISSDMYELSDLLKTLEKYLKEYKKNGVTFTLNNQLYKNQQGSLSQEDLQTITDFIAERKAEVKDKLIREAVSKHI